MRKKSSSNGSYAVVTSSSSPDRRAGGRKRRAQRDQNARSPDRPTRFWSGVSLPPTSTSAYSRSLPRLVDQESALLDIVS